MTYGDCSLRVTSAAAPSPARSLLPLQALHLLTQPCLHVVLGSPCGICWGGGGKTMVSFTHRLNKPGAISSSLAEKSSTPCKLFNSCSAKALCMPMAMKTLVCREEFSGSVIVPQGTTGEGQLLLKICCLKTDSWFSRYYALKISLI